MPLSPRAIPRRHAAIPVSISANEPCPISNARNFEFDVSQTEPADEGTAGRPMTDDDLTVIEHPRTSSSPRRAKAHHPFR